MKKSILALIVMAALCCQAAFAQGITVFRDANFQGQSMVIDKDWDASSNMSWNDQISSIRIPAGYKIQVFEHTKQQGLSKVLSGDWTVTGREFNDFISSIKFLEVPRSGIVAYRDANFKGSSFVVEGDWDASSNMDWNDQISSIRIPAGYKVQVFEHVGQQGASKVLTGNWTVNGDDFNDMISSIKVLEIPRIATQGGDAGSTQAAQGNNRQPKSKICCEETLPVDAFLESPNKRFRLIMQGDRNVVLYNRTQSGDVPTWATATNNNADRVVMQADGNLVVYNGTRRVWASNTSGNPNASLQLQDDGNLVIYSTDGRALWGSNTAQSEEVMVEKSKLVGATMSVGGTLESPTGGYFLILQNDRNLVLYARTGGGNKPLWATSTNNNADKAVMQDDGNFVVYNGPRAVWASNTSGNPNAALVLEDDGNLVIYSADNRRIWSTNTSQTAAPVITPVVVVEKELPVDPKTVPGVSTTACEMTEQQFRAAVHAVEAQSFSDGKMKVAKQSTKNKCLSLEQIRTFGKLFAFEDQTLEFLKYAYDFTNSKDDYYTLADIFAFQSNNDAFMKFLEGK